MSQHPAAPSAPPCLDAIPAFTLATGIAIPGPHATRAAWLGLPVETRDRIGTLAVDHAFAMFLTGDGYELEHRPLRGDDEAESAAVRRADAAEGELWETIERSLPELFGADGEDPECQAALNIDPGSASNFDPLDRYGGTPLISPAKRVGVA